MTDISHVIALRNKEETFFAEVPVQVFTILGFPLMFLSLIVNLYPFAMAPSEATGQPEPSPSFARNKRITAALLSVLSAYKSYNEDSSGEGRYKTYRAALQELIVSLGLKYGEQGDAAVVYQSTLGAIYSFLVENPDEGVRDLTPLFLNTLGFSLITDGCAKDHHGFMQPAVYDKFRTNLKGAVGPCLWVGCEACIVFNTIAMDDRTLIELEIRVGGAHGSTMGEGDNHLILTSIVLHIPKGDGGHYHHYSRVPPQHGRPAGAWYHYDIGKAVPVADAEMARILGGNRNPPDAEEPDGTVWMLFYARQPQEPVVIHAEALAQVRTQADALAQTTIVSADTPLLPPQLAPASARTQLQLPRPQPLPPLLEALSRAHMEASVRAYAQVPLCPPLRAGLLAGIEAQELAYELACARGQLPASTRESLFAYTAALRHAVTHAPSIAPPHVPTTAPADTLNRTDTHTLTATSYTNPCHAADFDAADFPPIGALGYTSPTTAAFHTLSFPTVSFFSPSYSAGTEVNDSLTPDTVTVGGLLTSFSKYASNVCDYDGFMKFCDAWKMFQIATSVFYKDPLFRYFRLTRYMNKQRVYAKFCHDLCMKYGDQDEILVVVGDWSVTGALLWRRKGQSHPAAYNKLITMMRNYGIPVYTIAEHHTSKRCHNCRVITSECSGIHLGVDTVSHLRGKFRKKPTHSRLMCGTCLDKGVHTIYNRDDHSCKNIYRLACCIRDNKTRPLDLCPNETKKEGEGKTCNDK